MELLRSADMEMDMYIAQAEFNRKFMMRRAGGRQQLRIWAQFPSSVERNECYDRLNERDTAGGWKSHVMYKGNKVEVWKPETRDQKYMMKKLIEKQGELAARYDVDEEDIREKLPIDKRYGTIKFNGKLVTWWDFDLKKPVKVEVEKAD